MRALATDEVALLVDLGSPGDDIDEAADGEEAVLYRLLERGCVRRDDAPDDDRFKFIWSITDLGRFALRVSRV